MVEAGGEDVLVAAGVGQDAQGAAAELGLAQVLGQPAVADAGEDGGALGVEVVEVEADPALGVIGGQRQPRIAAAHRHQHVLLERAIVERALAAGQRVKLEISARVIKQSGRKVEVEGVARDITERRRLERELLEVSNREQRRIGHDLHDGVCQQLAAITYLVDILSDRLQEQGAPESAEAERIGNLINEANAQARSVARGLFPVRLEEHGLVLALEELAVSASSRYRIICRFVSQIAPSKVDGEVELHLYYIVQEALLNAVNHGKATNVIVTLASDGDRLKLTVQDNGTGFDPSNSARSGMGIRIMRYRAKVIAATLELQSQINQGTQITCRFSPSLRESSRETNHG